MRILHIAAAASLLATLAACSDAPTAALQPTGPSAFGGSYGSGNRDEGGSYGSGNLAGATATVGDSTAITRGGGSYGSGN
jgi:hypothetical protein